MIKFIEYAAIDHSILFNKGTPLCIEWATSPNYNSLYEYPLCIPTGPSKSDAR